MVRKKGDRAKSDVDESAGATSFQPREDASDDDVDSYPLQDGEVDALAVVVVESNEERRTSLCELFDPDDSESFVSDSDADQSTPGIILDQIVLGPGDVTRPPRYPKPK